MNTTKKKNPAAVALGSMGKGCKHKALTPEQRAAAGRRGAEAFKSYWKSYWKATVNKNRKTESTTPKEGKP